MYKYETTCTKSESGLLGEAAVKPAPSVWKLITDIGYTTPTRWFSGYTLRAATEAMRVTSLGESSMAEYSGYENHLEVDFFDVLTQTLFVPLANLPDVDQYLTQPPSSTAFDLEPESSTPENLQEAVESVSGVVDEPQNGVVGGRSGAPRFGPRVTSSEIAALQETAVPQNTKRNISWAMKVWNDWCAYRKQQDPTDYPPWLLTMQVSELNTWLSRF